ISADDAMAQLKTTWGNNTDAKMATAKAYVEKVSQQWPGFKDWLKTTGLGNDPAFIRALVAKAEKGRA
ncbi:MAG: hypothetical protein ACYC9L_15910, partial [Sulfuricaulis sp.]